MKKIHSILVAAFFAIDLLSATAWGQLLIENFSYGGSDNADITLASSNAWVRHSGTQGPTYSATGLTYTGYASSGVGGSIGFTFGSSGTNDGDVNRTFTDVTTTNAVYVSLLVNLTSAKSTADYFFHLGPATIGNTFRGRVFARSNSTGWSLSLSKSGETAASDNTVLNFNQTYLIILKYLYSTASTSDDQVILYAYDTGVPASEPGSALVTLGPTGNGTANDPSDIGCVVVREGSSTPTGSLDGIRVATSWSSAPLPVELASFTALAGKNSVELAWNTATEVNNYGFDIERKTANSQQLAANNQQSTINSWTKVGFVNGNGTSNAPHNYSFTDNTATFGTYSYRLKQIDHNGDFEYSKEVEATIAMAPNTIVLGQNHPNPFNPETSIEFAVPKTGFTTLKVYNTLGQEVATLVNGTVDAGVMNQVSFNGNTLASGLYFYTLRSGNFVETKKMLMIK